MIRHIVGNAQIDAMAILYVDVDAVILPSGLMKRTSTFVNGVGLDKSYVTPYSPSYEHHYHRVHHDR